MHAIIGRDHHHVILNNLRVRDRNQILAQKMMRVAILDFK